ncbi:MAG TPA: SH3 domain-containing protein, partial [Chitinivibrionales bacterium]|nr:SH3 domain-containing protein [Chitinivibrionales bacterium]
MMHARFSCAVALFLFLALSVYGADNGSVTVSKDVARVLLMPYGDAKTLGIARKGDHLKVLSKNGEWYNVEFNGSIGWIFQANVEPSEAATSPPTPRQAKQAQSSVPSKQAPSPAPPPTQSQQAPVSAAPPATQQAPGATPQKPLAVQQNPLPPIVKPQPSAEPA